MPRALLSAGFVLLAYATTVGLAADSAEFEVASVKPAVPPVPGGMRVLLARGGPGTSDPGQVTYTGFTLKNLLASAYGVANYQISGPGWLDTEMYDILAKIPPDATKEQFALMLQKLLAQRFKLTLHHETKELPRYELVVAKNGPKLKLWVEDPNAPPLPSPGDAPPINKNGTPKAPAGTVMTMIRNGRYTIATSKSSVAGIAATLANQLALPVIDRTGLTGEYDYTLEFSPEGLQGGTLGPPVAAVDPDVPGLFTAVQEQLGLKLEQKKGPLDTLVIDHADKAPTGN